MSRQTLAHRRRLTTCGCSVLDNGWCLALVRGVKVKYCRQVIEGRPHMTEGMRPYIRVTGFTQVERANKVPQGMDSQGIHVRSER